MDVIDGEWIRARLTGAHGEKARLAAALGVTPAKISLILSGARKVQAEEIPKVLAFFAVNATEQRGFAESTATAFRPDEADLSRLRRILAPDTKHPVAYRMSRDAEWLGLRGGDVLLVDLNGAPGKGDIVVATVAEDDGASVTTRVFEFLAPWLIEGPGRDQAMPLDTSGRIGILGVVKGAMRSFSGRVSL